ncbi:DUF3159 domain-containing protein [Paraoerskovia marina]|uniref:DUF3159 domain-containing protein n=1 Tax=Paraoerskovia marina TaxID=545619 RepID=UPI00200A6484|nr:DUF3159 domain-containing protein [Paraoerskovia marina]
MSDVSGTAPDDSTPQGMKVLAADEFSVTDAVGGVRGLLESVAPGLIFVVLFVITEDLRTTLIGSVAISVVAVLARVVQRAPVTPALSGLLGVGIGVLWAWRSGDAEDYFALGLWTNAIYSVGLLLSILVRWPVVGVVVEGLRSGFIEQLASDAKNDDASAATPDQAPTAGESGTDTARAGADDAEGATARSPGAFARWARWRHDRALMRRYQAATWLWVGMFVLRLAVQVPLYVTGTVGWLGTARLVMGIPLFALTLWVTWLLVRRDRSPERATESLPQDEA